MRQQNILFSYGVTTLTKLAALLSAITASLASVIF